MIIGSIEPLQIGERYDVLHTFDPKENYKGRDIEQPYVILREATLEEFIKDNTERDGPPPPNWRPNPWHRYYEISTD